MKKKEKKRIEELKEKDAIIEKRAQEALIKINSLMKEKSVNELIIHRQYLPEIFHPDILEISESDGFPTFKRGILILFEIKGILIQTFGNVLKIFKVDITKLLTRVNTELLGTEIGRLKVEILKLRSELESLRKYKEIFEKLKESPLILDVINKIIEEQKKEREKELQKSKETVVTWYDLHNLRIFPPSNSKKSKAKKIKGGILKIVILGKKSLTDQFCNKYTIDTSLFHSESDKAIGLEFRIKHINFNQIHYKLQIWLLREEEKYESLIPMYLRGANGIILMYDITNNENQHKLMQDIELVVKHVGDIPTFLSLTELSSQAGKFFSPNENFAFTDITTEVRQNGENALELLTRKVHKNLESIKRKYAHLILVKGNRFFNKAEYDKAARSYEQAAQWSRKELLDSAFINEAFMLAINSWLSAFRPEKVSIIIQNMPQDEKIYTLKEIISKILAVVDYLIKNQNYKLAIENLNEFIQLYHLNDLLSEVQQLNEKQLKILKLMTKSSKKFKKIIEK